MLLLSLDVSSKSTGWAIINDKFKLLYYGVILMPDIETKFKLYWFYNYIDNLLKIFNPGIILVEDTYLRNVKTLKLLSQFAGIVNLLAALHNKEIKFLSPNKVRSYYKVKTKKEVFDFIKKKYKVKLKHLTFEDGNDITDAILQGLYYISEVLNNEQ